MGEHYCSVLSPGRFVSAPMAELTHPGYRHWCETYGGADMYFTEMIGVRAMMYGSPYESWYTESAPVPEKTVYQLWGVHEDDFFEATRRLADSPVLGIDINMGCSAPQIRLKGAGIGLMSHPDKAVRIVEGLRDILISKTLSVKIGIGETEDAGVDWITLNPRVRKDKHLRPGRREYVQLLKNHMKIPVIGNGDIKDWNSFNRRKGKSGADAYMIGRASVIRPWIFSELRNRENSNLLPEAETLRKINLLESADTALSLIEKWQPLDFHLSRARRFFGLWSANLKFGNQFNTAISSSGSIKEMKKLLGSYFHRNPEELMLGI